MSWGRSRRAVGWRRGKSAERLVGECEAYLSGHFGVLLEREGLPRPAWTWMNTLAHGEPERLATLARYGCEADRPPAARTEWDHAAALLALEIMEAVDHEPGTLRTLQREALVPLEAAWIAGSAPPQSPRQLVQKVMDALAIWRRRRGRRTRPGRVDAGHGPEEGEPPSP